MEDEITKLHSTLTNVSNKLEYKDREQASFVRVLIQNVRVDIKHIITITDHFVVFAMTHLHLRNFLDALDKEMAKVIREQLKEGNVTSEEVLSLLKKLEAKGLYLN
jgi:hypothetical protein